MREVAEFLNLYSKWRGINRFPGLVLLDGYAGGAPRGCAAASAAAGVLEPESLDRKRRHGSRTRRSPQRVRATGDADLELALAVERGGEPFDQSRSWSRFLRFRWFANRSKAWTARPTWSWSRRRRARLWNGNGPSTGCWSTWRCWPGQELGSKKEHLALAAAGRYEPDKILMVGDALGDLEAARHAGALFFPIDPGCEDAIVAAILRGRRCRDSLPGITPGEYMEIQLARFLALLPERPPWKELTRCQFESSRWSVESGWRMCTIDRDRDERGKTEPRGPRAWHRARRPPTSD